jgi:5'-methylthioadenosine phosphorylase
VKKPGSKVAIVAGTGVGFLAEVDAWDTVATPYGPAEVGRLMLEGREASVLRRHGAGHRVPPHRINYRANIWALQALGVREVIATQCVGSLSPAMPPGTYVVLTQFLDCTRGRAGTFFDGDDGCVRHVDVTEPYCPELRGRVLRAGECLCTALHRAGVYACTDGPRFETPAEIRALRTLGAELVGMTGVPEVVLAREAGLCYAGIAVVANWAAGMTDVPLAQTDVERIMREQEPSLRRLLTQLLAVPREGTCRCRELGYPGDLPVWPA